jgi:hypothetical protein
MNAVLACQEAEWQGHDSVCAYQTLWSTLLGPLCPLCDIRGELLRTISR